MMKPKSMKSRYSPKNAWRKLRRGNKIHKRRNNRGRYFSATISDIEGTLLNNISQTGNFDDTPSTSAAAKKFRKFKDDLKPKKKMKHEHELSYVAKRIISKHHRHTPEASISQTVTKKLLRSIRRRHLQHGAREELQNTLRRKLNLLAQSPVKQVQSFARKSAAVNSNTLEEGEIRTMIHNLDDDESIDCILVEPKIEHIIINDDDEVSDSSFETTVIPNRKSQLRKSSGTVLTSTPNARPPLANSTAIGNNVLPNDWPSFASIAKVSINIDETLRADSPPAVYFMDTQGSKIYDTIKSAENITDYRTVTSVQGKQNQKKRRSRRLRNETPEFQGNDVILIEDNCNNSTLVPYVNRKSTKADDSVIFVSETDPKNLPEYIPLVSKNVPNPVKIVRNPFTPKKKINNNSLFTNSEKKQLNAYNDNAYNPNAGIKQRSRKRMVLIDGSNVAFGHGLAKEFSVKGLKICIDHFERMGHEVKAIVPQFRVKFMKSSDPRELENLQSAGKVIFTPCKSLPGKSATSYDDRFILQLASELDAAIVSNDNYRDLIHENSAFKKLIENRVIGYTWCNDIFMTPKDPYGRLGPTLQSILNRE